MRTGTQSTGRSWRRGLAMSVSASLLALSVSGCSTSAQRYQILTRTPVLVMDLQTREIREGVIRAGTVISTDTVDGVECEPVIDNGDMEGLAWK